LPTTAKHVFKSWGCARTVFGRARPPTCRKIVDQPMTNDEHGAHIAVPDDARSLW